MSTPFSAGKLGATAKHTSVAESESVFVKNLRDIYEALPITSAVSKAVLPKSVSRNSPCSSSEAQGSLDKTDASLYIRLLKLEQELSPSGKVVCTLEKVRLLDSEQYYALSYAWGDDPTQESVVINGLTVTVRKTLVTFLKRARKFLYDLPLWVDAICINQESIPERNHQVSIMGQIYNRARRVLVWLGHSDNAFSYLFTRLNLLRACRRRPNAADVISLLEIILHLLQQPYWSRAWVVQELLLARSVKLIYDEDTICWNDLWEAVNECIELGKKYNMNLAMSIRATLGYQHYEQRAKLAQFRSFSINEVILQYGSTRCADIRDRVFAMLSLVDDGARFEVNYGWSPAELVLRTYSHFGGGLAHLERLMQILEVEGKHLAQDVLKTRFLLEIDNVNVRVTTEPRTQPTRVQQPGQCLKAQRTTMKQALKIQASSSEPDFRDVKMGSQCHACERTLPLIATEYSPLFRICLADGKFHIVCIHSAAWVKTHVPVLVYMLLTPNSATIAISEEESSVSALQFQSETMSALGLGDPKLQGQPISLPLKFAARLSKDISSSKETEDFIGLLQQVSQQMEQQSGKATVSEKLLGRLAVMLAGPRKAMIMERELLSSVFNKLSETRRMGYNWHWTDRFACAYWKSEVQERPSAADPERLEPLQILTALLNVLPKPEIDLDDFFSRFCLEYKVQKSHSFREQFEMVCRDMDVSILPRQATLAKTEIVSRSTQLEMS